MWTPYNRIIKSLEISNLESANGRISQSREKKELTYMVISLIASKLRCMAFFRKEIALPLSIIHSEKMFRWNEKLGALSWDRKSSFHFISWEKMTIHEINSLYWGDTIIDSFLQFPVAFKTLWWKWMLCCVKCAFAFVAATLRSVYVCLELLEGCLVSQ